MAHLLVQGNLSAQDLGRLSPEAFSVPVYRRLIQCAMQHLAGKMGGCRCGDLLDALIHDEVRHADVGTVDAGATL